MEKRWTLDDIKQAHKGHWFSEGAIKFFRSRISSVVHEGPGGIYFVSSEQPPHSPRKYTIRKFNPETGKIVSASDFGAFSNSKQAHRLAKDFAKGIGIK